MTVALLDKSFFANWNSLATVENVQVEYKIDYGLI